MSAANHKHDLELKKFVLSKGLQLMIYAFLAIGVATLVIALVANQQERLWTSYLVAFFYFSGLALGGLFFVAINNLSKAGWSVSIRRLSEGMTSFIPFILIGGLLLVAGFKYLFPWTNAEVIANNPLIQLKTAYLNTSSFVIRLVIFCAGWFYFRHKIVGNSLNQDQNGNVELTHKNVGYSIAFVLFFAISFSLFSVDLIMSLMPTWYSTIFGIYCFAGLFQASLAALAILIVFLRRSGFVKGYITHEHQHDVVKFTKGFTVFWAYIAFSQFMLIWYANIPEETEYYIMRSQNGWMGISVLLLIFRFIVPFIALLPKGLKRNDSHVVLVSSLILIMQYVDIYWMVYPNFNDGHLAFGLWEIGIFIGFTGLFMFTLFNFFKNNSLVPLKDPRLSEAINHHVTY
ncbi:MAG: molybdopterin oxidoreductase [Bdellovibrionota bacterium]